MKLYGGTKAMKRRLITAGIEMLIGSAAIETGTAMGMVGVAALLISAVLTAFFSRIS